MAKVKATAHPGQGFPVATLEIDGHPIRECTGYSIDVPLDGVATLKCSALVTEGFSFEGDATVQLVITVFPECVLVVESLPDGRTRYTAQYRKVEGP